MQEKKNNFFNKFLPKYSESYLFLVSFIFILLLIVNREFYGFIYTFFSVRNLKTLALALFSLYGCILSIFYAFSDKEPSPNSKKYMLIFVILLTFLISLKAFALSYTKIDIWLLFPSFNMVYSFLLLLLLRVKALNELNISSKNAKIHELIIGSFTSLVIILACNYLFNAHWTITFSLALTYANFFNKIFLKLFYNED